MEKEEYINIFAKILSENNQEKLIKVLGKITEYTTIGNEIDINNYIICDYLLKQSDIDDQNSKTIKDLTGIIEIQRINYQKLKDIVEDLKSLREEIDLSMISRSYEFYKDDLLNPDNLKSSDEFDFLVKNIYIYLAFYHSIIANNLTKILDDIENSFSQDEYCYDAQILANNYIIVAAILKDLVAKTYKRIIIVNTEKLTAKLSLVDCIGRHLYDELDLEELDKIMNSKYISRKEKFMVNNYLELVASIPEYKKNYNRTITVINPYERKLGGKEHE